MSNVLVIAPHPDDELLGVGGTIFKHKANGDNVGWAIVTDISRNPVFSKETIDKRNEEIKKVEEKVGFDEVFNLNYPPALLDSSCLGGLIKDFGEIFNKFKPEVIYIPFYADAHSDHRIIYEALNSCSKAFRYPFLKKVLMYETISETDSSLMLPQNVFIPNYFVNISEYMNKKLEVLKIYKSEMGEHPFPRSEKSIEALAVYRGSMSNLEYAEAFQVLKVVES